METNRILLRDFLPAAFDRGDYATDDTIAFVWPLFQQVLGFHESGLVAPFEREDALFLTDRVPDMDDHLAHAPSLALYRVLGLFPRVPSEHFEVVETMYPGLSDPLSSPAYIPGYRCFELLLGHHDPQTDIFCLGLVLGSIALGLNLYAPEDLATFARVRSNPAGYKKRIHPTIARLITEMTELNRNRRTQDLYDVIHRLQHYRDYDPEKLTDLSATAGWVSKDLKERDAWILNQLRNRLFDTSRRNRLLYYKPNMRFVNLTVSSVPVVLHYRSIRPELLFTWNEELAGKVRGMKEIVLNKYLRFEDHAYLPASLDKVRVESQRAVQEYGFSQLKLVIAFLNWHNLKEDPQERIQTPLLLIPVELKKNKRLKEDHYVLKVLDNTAEVNPVLAGQLKDLYGIRLPDFIDLDEMSPEQFHQLLKTQIEAVNQGIVLNYTDKPRIRLIYNEARQTVNSYNRRLGRQTGRTDAFPPVPYRYDAEQYKRMVLASPLLPLLPEINTREADAYELAGSESTPYVWDFDTCHMVLGNFNYKKMSLVRDYNLVIDQRVQHTVFNDLFGDQPRAFHEHPFDGNQPDDWYHVVTADPAQAKAILQSRAGYSYIIQGPPGTGKSQTITNLIADFVARGKNVLFVCEKRAALDVVYHRLKQNGLDQLCCYIHDSQGDKREFIKDLRSTYEDFTTHRIDLAAIRAQRETLLAKLNGHLDLIREFHTTSLAGESTAQIPFPGTDPGAPENFTPSARELIGALIALRQYLVPLSPKEEEWLPSYTEWQGSQEAVAGLCAALEETGAEPVFAEHPFSKVRDKIFLADNPHHLLDKLIQRSQELLSEIEEALRGSKIDPDQVNQLDQLKNLIHFSVLLYPLALSGNFRLTDPKQPEAAELGRRIAAYRQEQEQVQQAQQKNIHWRNKLSPQDLENGLAIALKHQGSMTGWLSGSWQKLKKQLEERYDFSQHAVKPSYTAVLGSLQAEYAAMEQVAQTRQRLQQEYRLENIDTAWLSIEIVQHKKGDRQLDHLLQHPEGTTLVTSLQALQQPLNRLETQLRECLHDPANGTLSALGDLLQNIRLNADALRDLLPALRAFTRLPLGVQHVLRQLPLLPLQLEAAVARKALHQVYQTNRAFAGIDRQGLEKAVGQIGECYTALRQLNADYIRAFVRQRFLQQIDRSNMASSQLDEEQKKFKKIYNEGRKILENEFGKSMRYKSIRELSSRESGQVLKDIKPVWLMSPYSVSDSLPLDSDLFDVVIFDEASQITLEEGVPALYRSRQTIIVGDEKQMPPSDFFSARSTDNDPDDLEGLEEEGSEWLSNDADSLLVQGSRKLNSALLSWHYRSHYETLISFSNHAFYEGGLLTIPDKTIHHGERTQIEVSRPEDAVHHADRLFDRSISFHFHTDSLYEKRGNAAEAAYIARLVRELLHRNTRESIGIVAFSQEQQHTIETALESLAEQDPLFARQLEEAYNRTENDQFTGLIVKNLENIQGDERDIIIMSVCYGFDARKKMLMNFGPVNKRGGEKRLNVLFSRAKMHMAVVSSIRHQHITNEYNEGANYLKRFLHYAEMISLGRMETARAILDSLVPDKAETHAGQQSPVILQQLKEQIRHLGYEVAEQVGQSDFKCSLAVKARPEDEQYTLGILIDDDNHYRNKNLVEQYYQRPAILQRFGWKVLPVFAKDWLHQPQKVIDQIVKLLREPQAAVAHAGASAANNTADTARNAAPLADHTDPSQGNAGAPPATGISDMAARTGQSGAYDHLDFQRLHHTEAGGEKFWEAATEGNKLVVRWGKTGTKGQIQLKTFPDLESARKEMEKLFKEKTGKGYLL